MTLTLDPSSQVVTLQRPSRGSPSLSLDSRLRLTARVAVPAGPGGSWPTSSLAPGGRLARWGDEIRTGARGGGNQSSG